MALTLLRFPIMTLSVVVGIHWQALRLWLKRTPVYAHVALGKLPTARSSLDLQARPSPRARSAG
jgi:DUF1365 family protein